MDICGSPFNWRWGKRIGDILPQDFIEAGVFEDPDTSSVVHDQFAAIIVAENVQSHIDATRYPQPSADSAVQSEDETGDSDAEITAA